MAACPISPWLLGWFLPPEWPALVDCASLFHATACALGAVATSVMFCLCLVRDLVLRSPDKSVSCMADVLFRFFSASNCFFVFPLFCFAYAHPTLSFCVPDASA